MTTSYGSWKSPITSDLIVAQSIGLSEIRLDGNDIYWAESRPHQAGRYAIVSHTTGKDLVAPPINVRTRVHEYGGGAWTVADGSLYYSNYRDQRLYRLDREAAEPRALTAEGPSALPTVLSTGCAASGSACGRIIRRRGMNLQIRSSV